jgi:hypothetical protein
VLTGDWEGVKRRLRRVAEKLEAEASQATSKGLALIEKTALGHLDEQDLNWEPLSEKYARYKARTRSRKWRRRRLTAGKENPRSLSPKILIATATYRQAITSYKTSPYSGEVGVSRQETNKDGTKLVNIGKFHEEGTKNMPQRELWGPTADELEDKILKNYQGAVRKLIDV